MVILWGAVVAFVFEGTYMYVLFQTLETSPHHLSLRFLLSLGTYWI